MSKTARGSTDDDVEADDKWTTVAVRALIYTNGSYRVTVTKAKTEIPLVEGDRYAIKTRDDGKILLDPQ